MATLTGKKPSETYKDLLQVSNSNSGVDSVERFVEDGEGTSTILKLSATTLDIDNTSSNLFKIGGTTLTATATELNYCDGVTSPIQAQINAKQNVFSTAENSFLVGGSSSNSVVNKTLTEVKTLLNLGTGATLTQGVLTDNIVQHGADNSADGTAFLSSGKIISKTSSQSRSAIGLGSTANAVFGSISTTGLGTFGNGVKLKLLSSPFTANSTNAGKIFYYSVVTSANPPVNYRYLSVIIQDGASSYAQVNLATKQWNDSGGGST